jgi:hypothetical protein
MALDGSFHPEPDMNTSSRFGGSKDSAPRVGGLADPACLQYQVPPKSKGLSLVGLLVTALIVVIIGLVAAKVVQDRSAAAPAPAPVAAVAVEWANPHAADAFDAAGLPLS